jgi:hypothetical protein
MKLKGTLIGAGVITLMCGGALYAVNAPSDLIEGPADTSMRVSSSSNEVRHGVSRDSKEVTHVSKSAKSSSDKHNSSSHSARGATRDVAGENIEDDYSSSQVTQEAKEGGPNMDQGNQQAGVAGSNGQVSGPSVSEPTGTMEPGLEETEPVGDTSISTAGDVEQGTPYQRGVDPYTDPDEQAKVKALEESVMAEQASSEAEVQSQHSAEQEAMRKYKAEHPELFGNGQ